MKRCNRQATWHHPSSGYRACRDHERPGMLRLSESGPVHRSDRCDHPTETKTAFCRRHGRPVND